MSDQKIKTASGKAPLGLIPAQALIGPSRVYGYGGRKYVAGNFYEATLEDGAGARYVSAALRHLGDMQLPNGLHTPESLATLDPESGLPHLDHAICGLLMLRAIMVKCAALPADPGVGNDPPSASVEPLCAAPTEETCGDECRDCATRATLGALEELETHAQTLARCAAEVAAEFSPFDHKWFDDLGREYRTDEEPQILASEP